MGSVGWLFRAGSRRCASSPTTLEPLVRRNGLLKNRAALPHRLGQGTVVAAGRTDHRVVRAWPHS